MHFLNLDFYQYTVIAAGISMLFMALPLLLLMFSCCFSSNKSLRESIALFTFLNGNQSLFLFHYTIKTFVF